MDLSKNAFSGSIPQCLYVISFGKIATNSFDYISEAKHQLMDLPTESYTYKGFSNMASSAFSEAIEYADAEVEIEFVTKYSSLSYKVVVLDLMFGLDLSWNKLTSSIPPELGQISLLHALNLSYNQLNGKIPESFSKLTQLESLYLSHNSLSGEIHSVLISLNFLEVFSVAHNNLLGNVPDVKAQFGTFDKRSYEENPFLCGPPVEKSCAKVDRLYPTPT